MIITGWWSATLAAFPTWWLARKGLEGISVCLRPYYRTFYMPDWSPAGLRRERDAQSLANRGKAAIWDLSDVVALYAKARSEIETEAKAKGLGTNARRAMLDDLDDRYGVVPTLASDLWGYGVVTEQEVVEGKRVDVEPILVIFDRPDAYSRNEREEREARSFMNRCALDHLDGLHERNRVGHRLTPRELAQVATDELAAFGRCGRPTETEPAKLIEVWDQEHRTPTPA